MFLRRINLTFLILIVLGLQGSLSRAQLCTSRNVTALSGDCSVACGESTAAVCIKYANPDDCEGECIDFSFNGTKCSANCFPMETSMRLYGRYYHIEKLVLAEFVEKLYLYSYSETIESGFLSDSRGLKSLTIHGMGNMEEIPKGTLPLHLHSFTTEIVSLTTFPVDVRDMKSLKNLSISDIENMESFPEGTFPLQIEFIQWIQPYSSRMKSLPPDLLMMKQLKLLSIEYAGFEDRIGEITTNSSIENFGIFAKRFPWEIFDMKHLKAVEETVELTDEQIQFLDGIGFCEIYLGVNAYTGCAGNFDPKNVAKCVWKCALEEKTLTPNQTSPPSSSSSSSSSSSFLPLILVAMCVFVVAPIIFIIARRFKRHQMRSSDKANDRLYGSSEYFSNLGDSKLRDIIPGSKVKIIRSIGRGANGEVLLAYYGGTKVVIKKLINYIEQEVEQFGQEIELLKSLKHPNIIQYLGVCPLELGNQKESQNCLVCEYMPGGDLKSALKAQLKLFGDQTSPKVLEKSSHTNSSSLPLSLKLESLTWEDKKAEILQNVLAALSYMHSWNPRIIHRDLKSANILLDGELRAKIADFGTSRSVSQSQTMTTAGTVFWMAPEMLLGKRFDEKADIYSLGIVLSELITNKSPFHDALDDKGQPMHPMAIAMLVRKEGLRPDISQSLSLSPTPAFIRELYLSCVDSDPIKRPTAEEALSIITEHI